MADRTIALIPAKPVAAPTVDRPFRVAAYCRVSTPSREQEMSFANATIIELQICNK